MKYLKKLKVEFVKGDFQNPVKGQMREPAQILSIFKDMKDWTKETLIGVYLNSSLELNSYEVLSIGGAGSTLVFPDEIFRSAILTNSEYFILVHNHPSGNAMPSEEDKKVMERIWLQSEIMQRYMLDFIIISDEGYWSMFEQEKGGSYVIRNKKK